MTHQPLPVWPVLKHYDQNHLSRIRLPIGGIGTGTVSLTGRGSLTDWEIMNRPAKGFTPCSTTGQDLYPFFAIRIAPFSGDPLVRLMEGPLEYEEYEGGSGSKAPHHGLPRFRTCSFETTYPYGRVLLSDPDLPTTVSMEAFNPLVPADPEASGLPVAVLRIAVQNISTEPVTVSVCGSVPNFVGVHGWWLDENLRPVGADRNTNTIRDADQLKGVYFQSEAVPRTDEAWGTMALCTPDSGDVFRRTSWAGRKWSDTMLDFWDDFSSTGAVSQREDPDASAPMASLAMRRQIGPSAVEVFTYYLTWHFPNRVTWTPSRPCKKTDDNPRGLPAEQDIVGNYYTTRFGDAWEAAEYVTGNLAALEKQTCEFLNAFCGADMPETVKEAALFNLSTLRSQTCFRTPDGRFYGWEGIHDHTGSCYGSCTHVWNYEQATAFLFGDLSLGMREIEFIHATDDKGCMSFRVNLPLEHARDMGRAAADGQMGCIMKMYRDWQLSGNNDFLRKSWDQVKKAMEFCWLPGSWDADRDGVMEGCQHNTMDVEYYGPNPQMQLWYLGALRAAEEMALYLGDTGFAAECRALFDAGSAWIDQHLFNGEYYEQQVRPVADAADIHPSLRIGMGADNLSDPDFQLGSGCLVDQCVGQFMAHICGLGYLADRENIEHTLMSIYKYNFRKGFHDHFNHMRSFVLGDESAMLMATYPRGNRPARPFPYYTEVMTGFEYSTAVHMVYEGLTEAGCRVIEAIRQRYDGRKRSPFNEAECGHHYARAMASWAAVNALSGFRYSAVKRTMHFAATPKKSSFFWSTGHAWGTFSQDPIDNNTVRVILDVLHGDVVLDKLVLTGFGSSDVSTAQSFTGAQTWEGTIAGVPSLQTSVKPPALNG